MKVLVTESNLQNIADAIREKAKTEDTYKPGEMAAAIRNIQSGNPEDELLLAALADPSTYTELNPTPYDTLTVKADKIRMNYAYKGTSVHQFCNNLLIPNATEIGNEAFYCRHIKTVDAPNVIKIGSKAFDDSLLESINFPKLQETGTYAFTQNKLVTVELPSIVSLGNYTFNTSDTLRSCRLGPNVTSIGTMNWRYCSVLEELIVEAVTPPTLSSNAFAKSTVKIYVPDGSVDAYKAATNWASLADKIYPLSERTA